MSGLEMWTTLNGKLMQPFPGKDPPQDQVTRLERHGANVVAAELAGTLPPLMQLRDVVPPPARDPSPTWRLAVFRRTPGPARSDA